MMSPYLRVAEPKSVLLLTVTSLAEVSIIKVGYLVLCMSNMDVHF
jgi:hypothetical protein